MNANELADKLRQQQVRIEQLEKLLDHSVGADCREMHLTQEIENRDAEIAELKTMRGNSVLVPSDKLAEMQAEIEALKDKLDEAEQRYWNNK